MQTVPDGVPHEPRPDPAVRQIQRVHDAKHMPAKRVLPQYGSYPECSGIPQA